MLKANRFSLVDDSRFWPRAGVDGHIALLVSTQHENVCAFGPVLPKHADTP